MLTFPFRISHSILRVSGESNRIHYCGNNECSKGFSNFRDYRDHVLFCEKFVIEQRAWLQVGAADIKPQPAPLRVSTKELKS